MKKVLSFVLAALAIAFAAVSVTSCKQSSGNNYRDDVNYDCVISSWKGEVDCYGPVQITLALRASDHLVFGRLDYNDMSFNLASTPSEEPFFACSIFQDWFVGGCLVAEPHDNGTLAGDVTMSNDYFSFELTKCDAPADFENPFYHPSYDDLANLTVFSSFYEREEYSEWNILTIKRVDGMDFKGSIFTDGAYERYNEDDDESQIADFDYGRFTYDNNKTVLEFEIFKNFLYVKSNEKTDDPEHLANLAGIFRLRQTSDDYDYSILYPTEEFLGEYDEEFFETFTENGHKFRTLTWMEDVGEIENALCAGMFDRMQIKVEADGQPTVKDYYDAFTSTLPDGLFRSAANFQGLYERTLDLDNNFINFPIDAEWGEEGVQMTYYPAKGGKDVVVVNLTYDREALEEGIDGYRAYLLLIFEYQPEGKFLQALCAKSTGDKLNAFGPKTFEINNSRIVRANIQQTRNVIDFLSSDGDVVDSVEWDDELQWFTFG